MNASRIYLALSLASLLFGGLTVARAEGAVAPDAFAQNQRLGRGVNILGYDPIWRAREQGRFKAEYFQKLKAAGFNSVRLNLHAFRTWTRRTTWKLPRRGLKCWTGR
jgi:endoglucanase